MTSPSMLQQDEYVLTFVNETTVREDKTDSPETGIRASLCKLKLISLDIAVSRRTFILRKGIALSSQYIEPKKCFLNLNQLQERTGKMMHRNEFAKIAIAVVFIIAVLVLFFMPRAAAEDVSGFADVQEDGTLIISGHPVKLYGIYVPPTGHTCQTSIRPMPCGSRAQLALNFKIEGEFVHCTPISENTDGSMTASCRVGNEDLSEWMLQRGWAVALPGAPFPFTAMENIAKSKGIGVWGIPVEVPPPRR